MNPIEAALRRVASDLTAARRRWALVGGLAVSARAEPRTTRDIDIAVAVADDADAESLVHALQRGGYQVRAVVEQEERSRFATARLVSPAGAAHGIVVDLLFASSGIEGEVADGAETLEVVPGLQLPVATVGHLLALKTLARDDRPPHAAVPIRRALSGGSNRPYPRNVRNGENRQSHKGGMSPSDFGFGD